MGAPEPSTPRLLAADRLDALFALLQADKRLIVGPTARDGAIVYDALDGPGDLPRGLTDQHAAGRYRLVPRNDGAYFGYNLGPDSWKKFLHPARLRLWRATRRGAGFSVEREDRAPRLAILGARACELAAIAIQDRVFLQSGVRDPHYAARREGLLVVAVQCGQASATCFCPSMGTGPRVRAGYDLLLTELVEPTHRFVVEAGSPAGEALLAALPTADCDTPDAADRAAEIAAHQINRKIPTEGLRERLLAVVEGPHWDQVASRCLGCANCTLVCPTCFCTTVTDVTDLDGAAERVRLWDSCFTMDFSHLHGGSVRAGLGSRYRQWLTHKLATWHDQFGSSGCVGCGRCISWCPAGIDITAEAIAASEQG